jgi:hypothetical protein
VTPIANLDKRLAQEIPLLAKEVLDNLKDWREAQEAFRVVKANLMKRDLARGVKPLLAEQRAAVHPQMRDAIAFTAYYGSQVTVAASALLALTNLPEELT